MAQFSIAIADEDVNRVMDAVAANYNWPATVVNPEENNENNLPIVIENKYQTSKGYSGNFYDINTSLRGGILYPALDPSIFEIKFPNSDIKGKVLGDNLGVRE